ncbi:MAG: choice-of-anchor Q domain-containing protein, partial [Planctomycetia bacterium]
NSTISGNSTLNGFGGGVNNADGGTVTITNSTITRNNAGGGGGGVQATGTVVLTSTIVAGNKRDLSSNDVGGAVQAGSSFNLIGDGGSGGLVDGVGGNIVGVTNALLAPLAAYGGSTQTHALLPGSRALNAGSGTDPDQRGVAPVGTRDIGAFESRGFIITAESGGGQSTEIGAAFTNPLVVVVTSDGVPVAGAEVTFTGPTTGASTDPATFTAVIGADGRASIAVAANGVSGSYIVSATAAGFLGTATFALGNGVIPPLPQQPPPSATEPTAPVLTTPAAVAGREDAAVALTIAVRPGDGSPAGTVVTVDIAGAPVGSRFSAGVDAGGGVWRVAAADLAGLTFTPPANFNSTERGVIRLTLTARAAVGDRSAASAPTAVALTVASVNDAPRLVSPRPPTVAGGRNGSSVISLVRGRFTDVDRLPRFTGLAITKLTGRGQWQFLAQRARTWRTIRTASSARPFLVPFFARLRFVPAGSGGPAATMRFRGWDQTAGRQYTNFRLRPAVVGGAGAFSVEQTTARLRGAAARSAALQPALIDAALLIDFGAN